jgi:hypothetical protein
LSSTLRLPYCGDVVPASSVDVSSGSLVPGCSDIIVLLRVAILGYPGWPAANSGNER